MKLKTAAAVPAVLILLFSMISSCTTVEKSPETASPEKPASTVERPQKEAETYENIEKMINSGDTDSAVKEFAKVKNDSSETVIAYAGLLMASGDYKKAGDELRALIEREPMNADAYFNLALVEGLAGDEEAEFETLEKAIAVDPGHSQALSVLGSIYLSESELKKSSEMFKRALESDPDNIIALTGLGSALIREEKYQEAEGHLNRAVELDPENPFTYLDRSSARAAIGDFQGAESDMSEAIRLEPDYFWHYLDRGRLRIRDLGDRSGALEDFNRAIEINPAVFYPYVFRAGIYDEMDEYELAAEDYKLVIDQKPDYYFAYSALGTVQFMLGDWEGCKASFESAFEYEPQEYGYLVTAVLAMMKQKAEWKETQEYYAAAMDKIPSGNIYYHIIRSFRESGYDAYALRKIQEEEDKNLQKRLLFYIAELYHENGMETAAYSYLVTVRDAGNLGYYESRMADYELENHYE